MIHLAPGLVLGALTLPLLLFWSRAAPCTRAAVQALLLIAAGEALIELLSINSAVFRAANQGAALLLLGSLGLRSRRIYPAVLAGIALVAAIAAFLAPLYPSQPGTALTAICLFCDLLLPALLWLVVLIAQRQALRREGIEQDRTGSTS